MAHGGRETEIKLGLRDAQAGRRLLRAAGFRVSRRRVLERNTVFDTPGLGLRKMGTLLRVREAGRVATVTYKGPADVGRHKSREELELEISNAGAMGAIFGRLGLAPAWRYEKYRTEFRRDRVGLATLDETPIGIYVELEGPPAWIDRAARRMGFGPDDYITASYARLYLDFRQRRNSTPADMVFRGGRGARKTYTQRAG